MPLALLAGAALLAAGCHSKPPQPTDPKDPKFVVAEKGDKLQITRGELDKQVADYLKASNKTAQEVGDKMPYLETAILDNLVLKKILLDKAAALNPKPDELAKTEAAQLVQVKGPMNDTEFAAQLKTAGLTVDDLKARIHEKALITKVLEAEAFKDVEPSEKEISDIYMKYQDHFAKPAQVRASRVLIHVDDKLTPAEKAAKKKLIDKAHTRVVKGEDFSKVATEVSEDESSKAKGGDMGLFQAGVSESPEFDKIAFGSKVGDVSAVFETPLGYQFIKVTEIHPAETAPLAEVRSFIANKLKEMKMQQAQVTYSKKLLADSGVTYNIKRAEMPARPPMPPGGPQPQPPGGEQEAPAPQVPPGGPEASAPPAPPEPSAPPAAPAPADSK